MFLFIVLSSLCIHCDNIVMIVVAVSLIAAANVLTCLCTDMFLYGLPLSYNFLFMIDLFIVLGSLCAYVVTR